MKKRTVKVLSLLLAAAMLMSLAACGKKGEAPGSEQLSGTVYTAKYIDMKLDGVTLESANAGIVVGDRLYFVGNVREDVKKDDNAAAEAETADADTAPTAEVPVPSMMPDMGFVTDDVVEESIWWSGLFYVELSTGECHILDGFRLEESSGDKSQYVNGIQKGKDNTLWVSVQTSESIFELPEGFDETKDDKWNYYAGSNDSLIWHHLDSEGGELETVDISPIKEKLGMDWLPMVTMDQEGRFYTNVDETIYVFDNSFNEVAKIPCKDVWDAPVLLGDGSMGVFDWGNDSHGKQMTVLDVEGQKLGKSYPVTANVRGEIFPGSEKYLFYYGNGDSLYGYVAKDQTSEKILSWSLADVNRDGLMSVSFTDDGRVVALLQDWWSGDMVPQMVILEPVDASTLPEKTHLTLAGLYISGSLRRNILEFNRKNTAVRIDIRDYSEFNTETDSSAGLQKLGTEIVAGNVPDILAVDGMPLDQYAARGLIEDLWPFIDNDPDLGRDKLMTRPLEAAEVGGILPQVFPGFTINSVVGMEKAVGDRMSWTLEDLKAAMANMPEGARIFSEGVTKADMLLQLLNMFQDDLVDWNTGECHFDSQQFKDILAFCDQLDYAYDWEKQDPDAHRESTESMMRSGKLLLQTRYLDELLSITTMRTALGDQVSYVGYPTVEGKVGSTFSLGSGLAMSSRCKDKDAAWSFMRGVLLDTEKGEKGVPSGIAMDFWGFPINKDAFDRKNAEAMKKTYKTDENGKQILDDNGAPIEEPKYSWYMDDQEVPIYAATQEDLDQLMELYNAVTSISTYDQEIYDIVSREADPFFKGDKSLDETVKQIQSRMNLYINEQM